MDSVLLQTNADYQKHFNARQYLETYVGHTSTRNINGDLTHQFCFRCYHEFWNELPFQRDVTLLEFGGGPLVDTLVSAAPHVSKIVFSDFVDANRAEVVAWKEKSPNAFNWSPQISYVVQELEGQSCEEVAKREEELRRKICCVIPCDLRASEVLTWPTSCQIEPEQFDIIATSFCIETVVASPEQYQDAIVKLRKLQKPGGYITIFSALSSTFYGVGKEKFKIFPVTQELMVKSLKQAGYQDVKVKMFYPDEETNREMEFSDINIYCFVSAKLKAFSKE